MDNCPICRNNSIIYDKEELPVERKRKEGITSLSPIFEYECKVCGKYRIDYGIEQVLLGTTDMDKRYILSGVTRQSSYEEHIITITEENYDQWFDSAPLLDGPIESMDRILLYFDKKVKNFSQGIHFDASTDYPIAFAKDKNEFSFFLTKLKEIGYFETISGSQLRLTIDGYKRLFEIKKDKIDSSQAFVAMWFAKEMEEPWENGFKLALKETGYNPIRIDKKEHNEKICDLILAEIRRSGLLVADFTGNRGGVYFEAGFALGLSIPVIWTCRSDNFEETKKQFDTRQYKYIVWSDSAELKTKLINRIEATLPNRKKRKFD